MNISGFFFQPFYWLASRLFAIWARPAIQLESPAEQVTDRDAAVCYVLENGGLADLLALERACRLSGLPSPNESLEFGGERFSRRFVVLRPLKGFLFRHPAAVGSRRLRQLVDAGKNNHDELLLIPVAIYWGRSPDKERSFFKLLFSENWDVVGRTRKFFATLLHGRNTLLRFSHALALSAIVQDGVEAPIAFRKVSRILRVHFRQRRAATVGPDLSHRQTLANQVLLAPAVKRAIAAEAGDDHKKQEAAARRVLQYVEEIAADVSYPTIRILMRMLQWLWNKIYDGIELGHIDRLHDVAKEKVIVYAPCHRSHFDYLLLSYICCREGIQLPHIAAGINLNLPILGSILRRGGAFYLRRSFKGNRLYATVFDAYLYQLLARGYSLEYFVEGGRSRTGRLLAPKGGMLAMTVNSYIQAPKRPVVFVPVYFGYEKLIIASGALTCLVLCSAASPAAVPADDETAPAVVEEKDKVLVKVEEIRTDGETKVKVKVVADGDGEHMVHWVGSPAKRGYLGVALNPLSAELQKHFGAPEGSGVMVGTVVEGSPAQAAGLKVGDVITAIDGTNVASATDVQRIIREKVEGETAAIALVRGGAPMTVEATVGLKEMQEFDIGLLGDIGDLKEKAFFISSGMEGGNMVFETIDGNVTVDLEDQMENNSVGFKSRGSRIISQLEKL